MESFGRLTIVVLASTEKESLKETLRLLNENCSPADIAEIIIFLISDNCPSAPIAFELMEKSPYPISVRCHVQEQKGLSQALFEIPKLVNSSHLLIIASDLEMDPHTVPAMIKKSKEHPLAIVCASKFHKYSKRKNYGLLHYICNRSVNFIVEKILNIKGSELISTFQIYPMTVYQKMQFLNPKRAFYEYTIRPLSMGIDYIEIPTNYKKRTEGLSNFNPVRYVNLGVTFILTALDERKRLTSIKRH